MSRTKHANRVIFATALIAIIAIFVFAIFTWRRAVNSLEPISPKYGPVVEAVYGVGEVKTNRHFEVKVSVPATIESIFVKDGQFIKKGQRLVSFEQGATFKAPFAGVVTWIPYSESESVTPQTTVLRMEDLKDLYLEVALDQQSALRVRKELKAKINFESLRGENYEGIVRAIVARSGEFFAIIDCENLPEEVLPGMTSDVAIEVAHRENVLLIPVNSITNGIVIRERDGKRKKVTIKLGTIDGLWAEVIDGDLKKDDLVMIKRK